MPFSIANENKEMNENEEYEFPENIETGLPYRVLIVDDDAAQREALRLHLTDMGITVDTAEDGLRALSCYRSVKYDMILTDIDMPNIDGWQLAKILRRQDRSKVPIVALSAIDDDDAIKVSLRSGMNDHLAKPYTLDELNSTITRWLIEHN